MFGKIKEQIHNIIMHECDDIIIDLMKKKVDIKVEKQGNDVVFSFSFAGEVIREDRITL